MWVSPLLRKSSSNDSVCFAAGDVYNGAHAEFHFSPSQYAEQKKMNAAVCLYKY